MLMSVSVKTNNMVEEFNRQNKQLKKLVAFSEEERGVLNSEH